MKVQDKLLLCGTITATHDYHFFCEYKSVFWFYEIITSIIKWHHYILKSNFQILLNPTEIILTVGLRV